MHDMTECNRTNNTTTPALCKADAGEQEPLSRAEIARLSTAAPTASECRRWLVIGLLADRVQLDEIVATTGYRPRTIREIAQRYHEAGAGALADRRTRSQGAPRLLAPSIQQELWHALQSPPPGGGDWTGPKVAHWIADNTGKRVHRQRGWEYLRRLQGAAAPARDNQQAAQAGEGEADGSP
jgi:transposase